MDSTVVVIMIVAAFLLLRAFIKIKIVDDDELDGKMFEITVEDTEHAIKKKTAAKLRKEIAETRESMDRQYADLTLMLDGERGQNDPLELETEQTAELRRAVKHEMAEMRERMDEQYADLTRLLDDLRGKRQHQANRET